MRASSVSAALHGAVEAIDGEPGMLVRVISRTNPTAYAAAKLGAFEQAPVCWSDLADVQPCRGWPKAVLRVHAPKPHLPAATEKLLR